MPTKRPVVNPCADVLSIEYLTEKRAERAAQAHLRLQRTIDQQRAISAGCPQGHQRAIHPDHAALIDAPPVHILAPVPPAVDVYHVPVAHQAGQTPPPLQMPTAHSRLPRIELIRESQVLRSSRASCAPPRYWLGNGQRARFVRKTSAAIRGSSCYLIRYAVMLRRHYLSSESALLYSRPDDIENRRCVACVLSRVYEWLTRQPYPLTYSNWSPDPDLRVWRHSIKAVAIFKDHFLGFDAEN